MSRKNVSPFPGEPGRSYVAPCDVESLCEASQRIDGAVVSILARLAEHEVVKDLVADLALIAEGSETLRFFAEEFLPDDDEPDDGSGEPSEISALAGALSRSSGRASQ